MLFQATFAVTLCLVAVFGHAASAQGAPEEKMTLHLPVRLRQVPNCPIYFECVFAYQQELSTAFINAQGAPYDINLVCPAVRNLLVCLQADCPSLNTDFAELAVVLSDFLNECGYANAFTSAHRFCTLFGDPHVRTFGGSYETCLLNQNEVVYADASNTVRITANTQPSWPDQDVSAVTSVTVVNSRVGSTHTYSLSAPAWTGQPSDLIRSDTVYEDTQTGLVIRLQSFPDSESINVYIYSSADDRTGVCVSGCPNRRRAIPRQVPSNPACEGLPAGFREACNFDIMASGSQSFATSHTSASQETAVFAARTTGSAPPTEAPFTLDPLCKEADIGEPKDDQVGIADLAQLLNVWGSCRVPAKKK